MLTDTVLIPDSALNEALHNACHLTLDEPLTTEALATLTTLDLSNLLIESLEGMEYCVNLQFLNIAQNSIVDITPIVGIVTLTYLDISSNYNMTNSAIQKIASLINIKDLFLSYSQVINFEFAVNMAALRRLTTVYSSGLASLKGIEGLNSLALLEINRASSLTDISALSTLPALSVLDLSYCKMIKDLSYIGQVKSLIRLDLDSASIQDISFMRALPNIQEVNLTTNFIKDLSPLTSVTSLKNIAVQDNYINDLAPLLKLVGLRRLYLQQNCITSVSPLLNLPDLEICNVEGNYLTDITEIESLSAKVVDLLYDHNYFINTPYQQAFSTRSYDSITAGESKVAKFVLCFTEDGKNYTTMKSKKLNGSASLNVSSSDTSVLTATSSSFYLEDVTTVDAILTGVSEGDASLSILFAYSDSASVNLPLTNGAYQQNISVITG